MALARYRFLTVTQMQTLELANRDTLYKTLRRICANKRNLVHRVRFGADGRGQMPDIFHLTKYGAEAAMTLGDLQEPVNYPARDYISRVSVPHNRAVVDCHIALDQWAAANNSEVEFCHRDFDPGKAKGTRRTSIQGVSGVIVPDMVFQLKTGSKSRLCVLELYRDESSTRVVKSLGTYPPSLTKIGEHYDYPDGVRVLAVFTSNRMIKPTLKALKNSIEGENWMEFFFASLENVTEDFRENWVGVDGKARPLF